MGDPRTRAIPNSGSGMRSRDGAALRRRGRHRRGHPAAQFTRGRWDLAHRAAAQQLDLIEPAWAIWYGVGGRHFHAVATWRTSIPLMVRARTIEELRDQMREAEVTTLARGQTALGWGDGLQPVPVRTSPPRQGVFMVDMPNGLRTACWNLPDDLMIVGKTRSSVIDTLKTWRLGHLSDDVALVVDELLGNAIIHGEPPIRLSLWAETDELCVRVTDHGPGQPRNLDLGLDSVHGRGLTIVAALADDHGVTSTSGGPGKTVWARWRVRTSAPHAHKGLYEADQLKMELALVRVGEADVVPVIAVERDD